MTRRCDYEKGNLVSVPFRGSFIQICTCRAYRNSKESFRPLPGILYSNLRYTFMTADHSSFRPLPGILHSNEMMRNQERRYSCFRPLTGILYSNRIINFRCINRLQFPSPYGDPLFKCVCGLGHLYEILCFRPLTRILYSNGLRTLSRRSRLMFPSPYGDPLFKW